MSAEANRLPVNPISDAGGRIAQLQIRIAGRIKLGLHSRSMRYGLRRDLSQSLEKPSAKIPIAVRPMVETDLPILLSVEESRGNLAESLEIAWRRAFVDKGAKGCFVAVDLRDDTPCYMQWLMTSADNRFIQRLGGFPELKAQEALLENAYTPVRHRGLGIMSAAMALIAERAADFGARYVLTFVDEHNIASLKGCQRAGFYPHLLHHKSQTAFGIFKRDRFEELPDSDPRRTQKF